MSMAVLASWQVQLDDNGRVAEVLDRTPEVRRVKIKSLSPEKNLAQMAEDIIDKCKYIHPSRVEEIEQLLIKLRKYMNENPAASAVATASEESKAKGYHLPY
jgi:Kinesin-associated protein (KAP)